MKKIILSAVVTAMALSTTASALEDIKVNGQAKLWYETNNAGDNGMFNKDGASGEVVFKLGITGKQGNIGFGATLYETSTMGLESNLVSSTRDNTTDQDIYVGEAYVTAPLGAKTLLKFGKQELDTPLAFTERWNATPNTFNAAVAINNSINNLTLIGAYVGQSSNTGFKSDGTPEHVYGSGKGTYAIAALYKNDAFAVNVWAYELSSLAKAVWIDASIKAGPVALKGYAAQIMAGGAVADALGVTDDTTAFALSAGMKMGSVKLFAAASTVSDDQAALAMANTATGGKKTKLPTMAVYTDGKYVARPGSTAFKLKAATKIAGTGLALQYVNNSNDDIKAIDDMSEIDLIATTKLGDINLKGILMHRDGNAGQSGQAEDSAQQHFRVIASINF